MMRSSLRRAALTGGVFFLSTLALTLIYYPDLYRRDGIFDGADHLYYISSYLASRRFGSLLDLQTFPFGQGFGIFQHPALILSIHLQTMVLNCTLMDLMKRIKWLTTTALIQFRKNQEQNFLQPAVMLYM